MERTRPAHPEAFRREVVELVRSSPERTVAEIVNSLGVSDQTLRNWLEQAEIDRGARERLTTEEREELRRFRREVRMLRRLRRRGDSESR